MHALRVIGGVGGGEAQPLRAAAAAAVPFDVNGDGFADLVAGAPGETLDGAEEAGAINVVGDLAVGVPGEVLQSCDECEGQGAVNVLLGSAAGLTATGNFGRSLAAGDFDGDADADLAVAADGARVSGHWSAGAVYLLNGSASGLTANDLIITQDTPGVPDEAEDGDGSFLNLAAHRYGGGTRDWLAIAYPQEDLGEIARTGQVIVVPGSAAGLDPSGSRAWHQNSPDIRGGSEPDDRFGSVDGTSSFF
jgi:FG-GAP repeat